MKVYGLLLAAGRSTRMGQPKQLLDWRGRPLVAHLTAVALASRLDGIIVVVGAAEAEVRAALRDLPVTIVTNPAYTSGMASSLATGLRALPADAAAALILLVDQPLVTPALLNRLIDVWQTQPAALAVVPFFQGERGNPALIAAPLFADLLTLEGDTGARAIFARYPDRILRLDLDDPAVITDIDTPGDVARLRASRQAEG